MFFLVLLLSIGSLEQASTTPNRRNRPPIPNNIALKPSTIKVTNIAGSAGNKGQQISLIVSGQPDRKSCLTPGDYGWQVDDIMEIHRQTNLTLERFDSLCTGSDGYMITKGEERDIVAQDCMCPSFQGWSYGKLMLLQQFTKLTGTNHDCFCSSLEGYSLHILQPIANTEEKCQCPTAIGWTPDELEKHFSATNVLGKTDDCFCKSLKRANGYVLRQKQIPQEVTESLTTDIEQEVSTITEPIPPTSSQPEDPVTEN